MRWNQQPIYSSFFQQFPKKINKNGENDGEQQILVSQGEEDDGKIDLTLSHKK